MQSVYEKEIVLKAVRSLKGAKPRIIEDVYGSIKYNHFIGQLPKMEAQLSQSKANLILLTLEESEFLGI